MKALTTATLAALAPEVEAALADLSERHGIKFSLSKGSADRAGLSASFKLDIEVVDPASGKSAEQRLFETIAPQFGFSAGDYGREFTYGRTRYRLVGFNPNSPVNCLSVENARTGTKYMLSLDMYRKALELEGLRHRAA